MCASVYLRDGWLKLLFHHAHSSMVEAWIILSFTTITLDLVYWHHLPTCSNLILSRVLLRNL